MRPGKVRKKSMRRKSSRRIVSKKRKRVSKKSKTRRTRIKKGRKRTMKRMRGGSDEEVKAKAKATMKRKLDRLLPGSLRSYAAKVLGEEEQTDGVSSEDIIQRILDADTEAWGNVMTKDEAWEEVKKYFSKDEKPPIVAFENLLKDKELRGFTLEEKVDFLISNDGHYPKAKEAMMKVVADVQAEEEAAKVATEKVLELEMDPGSLNADGKLTALLWIERFKDLIDKGKGEQVMKELPIMREHLVNFRPSDFEEGSLTKQVHFGPDRVRSIPGRPARSTWDNFKSRARRSLAYARKKDAQVTKAILETLPQYVVEEVFKGEGVLDFGDIAHELQGDIDMDTIEGKTEELGTRLTA